MTHITPAPTARSPFPILTTGGNGFGRSSKIEYLGVRAYARPFESLVSLAWRYAAINTLEGTIAMTRLAPTADPYEGALPRSGALDGKRLAHALGIARRDIERGLLPSANRDTDRLRYCERCLRRHGFHAMSYQASSRTHCPIHHRALVDACDRCGHPVAIALNAAWRQGRAR